MGVWCKHCDVGAGCVIYETRPRECEVFYCLYRTAKGISELWRPRDSHMVMTHEPQATRINVWVDTEFSGVWRNPQYLRPLRQLAQNMLRRRGSLIVWEGNHGTAILPDREINLGLAMHKQIVVMGRDGPNGEEYNVEAWERDDPRLTQI
ncbi:MAG: hypothetical protein HY054_10970 [Proteobacteria bacterium]|nr:hypothetical protein [Pseudomonadota bacterium]